MAKEKSEEMTKIGNLNQALVNPDDLKFLDEEAELMYEPSIMKIDVGHQVGLFTAFGASGNSISGIILSVIPNRVFYGFQADRNYPVCISSGDDALSGIGNLKTLPTDDMTKEDKLEVNPIITANCLCSKCHWAEYGTSEKGGKSQACRMTYRLLIWNPDTAMYGWVAVSPTSFKAWANYKAGNQHFSRVVTKISLSVQKKGAYTWSTFNFAVDRAVDLETVAPLKKLVVYKGKEMLEVHAAINHFKNVSVKEQEEETNGHTTPTSGGKVDDF